MGIAAIHLKAALGSLQPVFAQFSLPVAVFVNMQWLNILVVGQAFLRDTPRDMREVALHFEHA